MFSDNRSCTGPCSKSNEKSGASAESAVAVTNQALQLHGAVGYSRDLPLERMVRDVRVAAIEFRDLSRSLKQQPSQLMYEKPPSGMEIPR